MTIVAERGGPAYLLVRTRVVDGQAWGRVFDVRRCRMSPEALVASIARFGYWEEVEPRELTGADVDGVTMTDYGIAVRMALTSSSGIEQNRMARSARVATVESTPSSR